MAIPRRTQRVLVSTTVNLTPHGQGLLEAALARGVGGSPEDVIERALEEATGSAGALSKEEGGRRRKAVASVLAFRAYSGEADHDSDLMPIGIPA